MNSSTVNSYRVRLLLSYDGSNFCGWQSQLVHKNMSSVQTTLEKALTKIYKEPIHCVASGRTDAGVHALAQNVHFTVTQDPQRVPLLLALRTLLPPTISVKKAWLVPPEFSANTSAFAKTYRYYLWTDDSPSAIHWRFTCWYPHQLSVFQLQKYADKLIGWHDFKSFQSMGGRPPKTTVRRIYRARWTQPQKNLFVFEITGSGFLRQMIRNLVATQLKLYQKQAPANELVRILAAKDRSLIGKPAAPNGLFLARVHYPRSLLMASQAFALRPPSRRSKP